MTTTINKTISLKKKKANLASVDVFVYCSGKCGSSTLYSTFIKNKYDALHIHNNHQFQEYVIQSTHHTIFDVIDHNASRKQMIYIIDSYRTPIERKISSFFQNLRKHVPNYRTTSIDELITIFNKSFLTTLEEYHSIEEALRHYQLPNWSSFDFDKKYNIQQKGNLVFIKIRFHDINQWDKILSNIFQTPIKIFSSNLSGGKQYDTLYQAFKLAYHVPDTYLKTHLVNDKNFKIYNTEQEQTSYLKKWGKTIE